ncbi:MAG: hypothetical protein CR972_05245 [Candidatus Moraniibacteriota bacterium]|nr:MAG: hypothetical protein CR972_05245 [Candidatus Moranbacteria bacterium]
MFSSTKKKIWFGIFTTLIIILSGYGVFVFKKRQEHKHAAAKIAEYCQNPKVELATSEYRMGDLLSSSLETNIRTEKFNDVYIGTPNRPYALKDKTVLDGVKRNIDNLCSVDVSRTPERDFIFWYKLDEKYSIMGLAENKVELGRVGSDLGNLVDFFVVNNDTQAVVYGFEITAYIHRSHESKDRYRRITGKDIREIAMIVLRDNVPSVLQ